MSLLKNLSLHSDNVRHFTEAKNKFVVCNELELLHENIFKRVHIMT